jgi:hypothetical protein
MTDKYKYKSISLKTQTVEMIEKLSDQLVPGKKLSSAGTVQKLVIDTIESKVHNNGNDNEQMHTHKFKSV